MRELRAFAVLAALLVLAWWGWRLLFEDDAALRLELVQVDGEVLRVSGTDAAPARTGDRLAAQDRIQARDGTAVLAFGNDARVTVDKGSAIQVTDLSDEGVSIELENGKVHATVHPGAGQVRVGAGGPSLSASDADFTAVRRDGGFAVEGERGEVLVSGVPGLDRVRAGERAVSAGGGALTAPANADLLLSVVWPNEQRTRQERVTVRGSTEPGARVRLGPPGAGVEVLADDQGRFEVELPLAEGHNRLEAVATGIFGNEARVVAEIVRDTQAPTIGVTLHP